MAQTTYPNLPSPAYFDYQSVAAAAGVTPDELTQLYQLTAADYPGDAMMTELRMLRTCRAIKDGFVTTSEAIRISRDQSEAA
jgi:hypothetical protein